MSFGRSDFKQPPSHFEAAVANAGTALTPKNQAKVFRPSKDAKKKAAPQKKAGQGKSKGQQSSTTPVRKPQQENRLAGTDSIEVYKAGSFAEVSKLFVQKAKPAILARSPLMSGKEVLTMARSLWKKSSIRKHLLSGLSDSEKNRRRFS